LFPAAALAYG